MEHSRIYQRVHQAVKTGKLNKPELCTECDDSQGRIEGHHDDYSKPLEVRWLCRKYHRALHGQFNFKFSEIIDRPRKAVQEAENSPQPLTKKAK